MSELDEGRYVIATRLSKLLWVPPLVIYVLMALPVVGNLVVIAFSTNILGCHISAASPTPCIFFGSDIGETNYGYGVGLIALGITNPFLAAFAFYNIIPKPIAAAWIFALLSLEAYRDRLKRKLERVA